jgi:hypothetical protein
MYNITTTTWTMKRLLKEFNNINFRCPVQRGFVWDIGRQSLFIHSLLNGDIIPPLFIRRLSLEDGNQYKMEARDGQQRCTTVYRFMKGEFKLSKIPEYKEGDKFDFRIARGENEELQDINGLSWNDLTEEEKDRIKDATISIYYIDNATDIEADMIFFKLNNGKSLTNTELARAQAKSRDTLKALSDHKLFATMFSEKALVNSSFDMATKMWFMLNEDEPNLMSSHIKAELKSIDVTPEESSRITNVLDFALLVYNNLSIVKIAKRMITKTHFLSLVPIIDRAIEDDINPAKFVEFVESFYDGKSTKEPTINSAYNGIFDNASASRSHIRVRHNALMNHYEKLFNGEKEDIYSTDLADFENEDQEDTKEENKKEKRVNYDEVIDLNSPVITEPEPEQPKVEKPKQELKKKTVKKPEKPVSNPKEKEKAPTAPKTAAPKKEEPIIMSTADYNKQLEEKRKAKEQEKANKSKLGIAPF